MGKREDDIKDMHRPPSKRQSDLHLIRSYAAHLRRVSDAYGRLEEMARESKTEGFASLVAFAGRAATAELSTAGEMLSVIEESESH